MDTAEVTARILRGIDEDPASPSAGAVEEVAAAINEGQELFSWLTLCLESTATINLGTTFGTLRPSFPDFLCPLKLTVGGARVRPATFADLDALDSNWQLTPGTPTRYVTAGFNFLAIYPQESTAASLTYARSPTQTVDTVFLDIPEEYHISLVKFGIYRVRLKEGAQGLERGLKYFNEFLDDAQRLGDFVRARSRALGLDTLPLELSLYDRSRLLLKPLEAEAKKQRRMAIKAM